MSATLHATLAAAGVAILIGFCGSHFTLRAVIALARRYNIVDFPAERKPLKEPRPRLGGISIFLGSSLAFYILLLGLHLTGATATMTGVPAPIPFLLYLCSLFFLFLLGVYDDCVHLGIGAKLTVEWGIASVLFLIGFRIELVTLPFFADSIPMGVFTYPVTVLWLIGIANAINLIDGIDGLAGGVIAIAGATIIVICLINGNGFPAAVVASLLGAVLGFLPFNLFPSRIMMGDGGSLFAGAVLATQSLYISQKAPLGMALMIPILFLAIPVLDTTLSFLRRLAAGRNPLRGDNDHIHHRLMRKGFSERKSANILIGLTAVFSGLSIVVSHFRGTLRFLGLLSALVLVLVLLVYLNYLRLAPRRREGPPQAGPGRS